MHVLLSLIRSLFSSIDTMPVLLSLIWCMFSCHWYDACSFVINTSHVLLSLIRRMFSCHWCDACCLVIDAMPVLLSLLFEAESKPGNIFSSNTSGFVVAIFETRHNYSFLFVAIRHIVLTVGVCLIPRKFHTLLIGARSLVFFAWRSGAWRER